MINLDVNGNVRKCLLSYDSHAINYAEGNDI